MTERFRIVCDTNIILSAALSAHSIPRSVLNTIKTNATLLTSREIIEEIQDVFARRKFDKYLTLEERFEFLQALLVDTESVEVISHITDCIDPQDNKFLELAVDGNADYIVTGDDDLLSMNPFRNIPILSPSNFLREIHR